MAKRKWGLFAAVIAAFVALFGYVALRHQTPPGQPQLANLTGQSLPQLQQEFNASVNSERVLLLLSPTCPVCVAGGARVNAILKEHPDGNVRVFAIWEPILPTDWNRPTTSVLSKLSDLRAAQFWDKQHLMASLVKQSASRQPGCCKRRGVLWDIIAVYPPGARWTNSLPEPEFFAGPVVRGAPQWETAMLQH